MDDSAKNLPAVRSSLDRSALERVLARAAELQAAEGEPVDAISEQQLLDIGKEVGLSSQHLRQAIAEEKTRLVLPGEGGRADRYFGPTHVGARRIVKGTAAVVLQRLDRWMDKEECLQVKRRFPDAMSWEARRDFLGSIKRGFNVGGRGYALADAHEVAGTVTELDEGNVLVQLTADYENKRRRAIWGGTAVAGAFTGGGGLLFGLAATLGGSLLVSGVLCGALAGFGGLAFTLFAKSNRELLGRAQLALEQALDRLEHHADPPTTVFNALLSAAAREPK